MASLDRRRFLALSAVGPAAEPVRPGMNRMARCANVGVTGAAIRDSPMWVQHYPACAGVSICGTPVHWLANANNNGVGIDCFSRVRIPDCDISSRDGAIVLKSTAKPSAM